MTAADPGGDRIEKLMTMSAGEFAASLARLTREPADGAAEAAIRLGAGVVTIRCEPVAPLKIGALPPLPRARVTLRFDGVSETDRAAFVRRFDIAFQRGGG